MSSDVDTMACRVETDTQEPETDTQSIIAGYAENAFSRCTQIAPKLQICREEVAACHTNVVLDMPA